MQKVKIIFNQSIMISAATLLGIGIQMFIQHIVSGEVTFTWKWYIPISICLTGFLSSLPTCFLLDLDRLKKKWYGSGLEFILSWLGVLSACVDICSAGMTLCRIVWEFCLCISLSMYLCGVQRRGLQSQMRRR